jgi:lysophospholipase L1-like esterase
MSDPYLLAVSLLTTGQVAVPPPLVPPSTTPEDFLALLDISASDVLQPAVPVKTIPLVELTTPEFSKSYEQQVQHSGLSTTERSPIESQLTTPVATPVAARELTPTFPPLLKPDVAPAPSSGSQLYLQRLAALKAGKLYTRLSPDSFYSSWKSATRQPTHEQWKRLLAQEAKAIARGQGNNRLAILVGDSLSQWFPSAQLPNGKFWLNQGISGENSSQVLQRLPSLTQTRPETIYVMTGINDLRQGATDTRILNNIRQIVRRLRSNHPQSQIIVQSILPTRLSAIPNARIRNLNQQIAKISQQEGAGYLNLHALFIDSEGQLQHDLTTDGIHLTRRGYQVWQDGLQYAESWLAANIN